MYSQPGGGRGPFGGGVEVGAAASALFSKCTSGVPRAFLQIQTNGASGVPGRFFRYRRTAHPVYPGGNSEYSNGISGVLKRYENDSNGTHP